MSGRKTAEVSRPPTIDPAEVGSILDVQTRYLILAALLTGAAILAAAAIWFAQY